MSKIILISLILINIISCSSEYDEKGKINNYLKKVEQEDTLKISYTNSNQIKTVVYPDGAITKYYKNGNIFLKGKLNQEMQRISEWHFYTYNGKLSEIREYFIVKDRSVVNQAIYFDDEGYKIFNSDRSFNRYDQAEFSSDTLRFDQSFFKEIILQNDTLYQGEYLKGAVFYHTPIYKGNDGSKTILIIGGNKKNFNKDFSNVKKATKDTFNNLLNDTINQKYFPDDDPGYSFVFGKKYETSGKKYLRGYITEYYFDGNQNKTEVRIYFEKEIYVKEIID